VETRILLQTLRVACQDRDFVLLSTTLSALGGKECLPAEDPPYTLCRVAAAQVAQCASGAPTPENFGSLSTHLATATSILLRGLPDFAEKAVKAAQALDAAVRPLSPRRAREAPPRLPSLPPPPPPTPTLSPPLLTSVPSSPRPCFPCPHRSELLSTAGGCCASSP
jgi:hypothetical protein